MIATALMLIALALGNPLDADNYDTFADCMHGPGRGCESSYYKAKDCDQRPGDPVTCVEYTEVFWQCVSLHPICIRFDLDHDLDVDLRDFAILQRNWK